jgi:hypothetical protein
MKSFCALGHVRDGIHAFKDYILVSPNLFTFHTPSCGLPKKKRLSKEVQQQTEEEERG